MSAEPHAFARALIAWHERSGRHDLPWQHERTPYRVWVSEIMLQQTQVATVVPYYERFMRRFPDLRALADAPLDEVLHLWAGLGYYARARNLHRAAVRIRDEWDGNFPASFEDVASLPGIGRSTAGAVLALSRGERWPILDGNVRRVLARCFGVEGDPSARNVQQQLWALADRETPDADVGVYTQAVMDLGATVCVRHRPACALCPLAERCVARQTLRQHELPAQRRSRVRRLRRAFMIAAMRDDGGIYLERRPEHGVWGGLWCLPEFATQAEANARWGSELQALGDVEHAFTHFDLVITPLFLRCRNNARVMDEPSGLWYKPRDPVRVGLPAPIKSLLEELAAHGETS